MNDSRHEELWERVLALNDEQKAMLLAFTFGFERECKGFHDAIEKAITTL